MIQKISTSDLVDELIRRGWTIVCCEKNSKIDKKAVGFRIKQFRLSKGYTLEEFGSFFNASKGNVQQWENGRSLPNKERIKQISIMADITVNELLYGSMEEVLKNKVVILKNTTSYINF